MSLIGFFAVEVCLLAVAHGVYRRARRTLEGEGAIGKLSAAGRVALFGFARGVFLVGVLSTAALMAVLFVLGQLEPERGNNEDVARILSLLRSGQEWMQGFGTGWGVAALVLVLVAFGLHARRKGLMPMKKALEEATRREIDILRKKVESGELEHLPPDAAMVAIGAEIQKCTVLLARAREFESQGNAEATGLITTVEKRIEELNTLFVQADIARRITVTPDPVKRWRPSTPLERIQTFFMSEGLMANLGRGQRALFLGALALLVPCFVSVQSGATGKHIETRVAELADIRIQWNRDSAAESWEQAKGGLPAKEEVELTEEDLETITQVAGLFEENLTSDGIWDSSFSTEVRAASRGLRAMAASAQILEAFQGSRQETEFRPSGSRADIPDNPLSAEERKAAELFESDVGTKRPVTRQGVRVRDELVHAAKRKPGLAASLREELAMFQRPADSRTLTRGLVRHALGAVDGIETPLVQGALEGADSRVVLEGLSRAQAAKADVFLSSVSEGRGLQGSLARVQALPLEDVARLSEIESLRRTIETVTRRAAPEQLLRRLDPLRPAVDLPIARAGVDIHGAQLSAASYADRAGVHSERVAQSLASYRDYFPAQAADDLVTPSARLVEALESLPSGGGGGGAPASRAARLSEVSTRVRGTPKPASFRPSSPSVARSGGALMRSRSFGRLRGFSRVGGVLFGRPPENADSVALDFRELRWRTTSDGLILDLIDAHGRVHSTPPESASLVCRALAFAADGRPLAVTMTIAEPLPELKILLHPTLVDSPIGVRLIELDRFVDTFVNGEERELATSRVQLHADLYRLAWAIRFQESPMELVGAKLASFGVSLSDLGLDEGQALALQFLASSLIEGVVYPESPALLELLDTDGGALHYAQLSPLAAKPEYFEASLVASLVRAIAGIESAEELVAALHAEFRGTLQPKLDRLRPSARENEIEAALTEILTTYGPPPTFEVWSGVRERAWQLDAEEPLGWLDPTDQPVEFMLQVAFTSPPAFLPKDAIKEDEEYSDTTPWEFPHLAGTIRAGVMEALASPTNLRDRQIYEDACRFVRLQRLFRALLEGHLGEEFDVSSLAELARATASAPEAQVRTLSWNVREGQIERQLAASLVSSAPEADELAALMALFGSAEDLNQSLDDAVEALLEDIPESNARGESLRKHVELLKESLLRREAFEEALASLPEPQDEKRSAWNRTWAEFREWRQAWQARWERLEDDLVSAMEATDAMEPLSNALDQIQQVRDLLALRWHLLVFDDYGLGLESVLLDELPAL